MTEEMTSSVVSSRSVLVVVFFAASFGGAARGDGAKSGSCPGSGDCCLANGTPGCLNFACCEDICFFDPFCCDSEWDAACAGAAVQLGGCCGGGGGGECPGPGDCCVANGSAGCDDASCCVAVCACDSFCCDTDWDAACAGAGLGGNGCGAEVLCDCGGGGGPSNDECADAVLVGEGTIQFETIGATTDGPALPASCDEGFGLSFQADIWFLYTPSCDGAATVSLCDSLYDTRLAVYTDAGCPGALLACNDDACGTDGFESELTVDVSVGISYLIRIGGFNGMGLGTMTIGCESACSGVGGCCWANGLPSCDDSTCCTQVCAIDPSCCETSWSGVCVAWAEALCGSVCECGAFGDFDGDGDRDVNDYVELFGCVTAPGVPSSGSGCSCGDSDGDGDVDLLDVGAFMALADGGG